MGKKRRRAQKPPEPPHCPHQTEGYCHDCIAVFERREQSLRNARNTQRDSSARRAMIVGPGKTMKMTCRADFMQRVRSAGGPR